MTGREGGEVWLVRHGETEWSRDRRHTSRTDLALTDVGVSAAEVLHDRLTAVAFDLVLTSPRERARRTAALAGFPDAEPDADLVEWDYGDYEGITTAQIQESVPGWSVWTHESPGGESSADVTARTDRVVERIRATGGRVLVFGHGHHLRAFAARWLGVPVLGGRHLRLDTATVSVLGYEHEYPAIIRWNG
jgi:broad specificity phosphatase PhoE